LTGAGVTVPAVAEKRPRVDLLNAVIAAGAAIIGGVVVAVGNYFVTVKAEQAETERAERRLEEEARGAARLLITELLTAHTYTNTALEQGSFFGPVPEEYKIDVPAADLRLVQGRLSPAEYNQVAVALESVNGFALLSRLVPSGEPFGPNERRSLEGVVTEIRAATGALRRVANVPRTTPLGGYP
jgi:hypothetical protein